MSDFDFDQVFALWLKTKRFTADPRTLAQIRVYVEGMLEEEGGYLSIAHFERAYLMLREEGEIPEFREPAPEPEGETPIDLRSMPVAEIQRRYKSDAAFRAQYDRSNGRGDHASVPQTAEEYHALGTRETIRRYGSDQAFRAAVDRLIAEGKI